VAPWLDGSGGSGAEPPDDDGCCHG
jgi:hypothetical protein